MCTNSRARRAKQHTVRVHNVELHNLYCSKNLLVMKEARDSEITVQVERLGNKKWVRSFGKEALRKDCIRKARRRYKIILKWILRRSYCMMIEIIWLTIGLGG